MAASRDNSLYHGYERARSFVTVWIGLIVTSLAVGVIFIVASLEGTREIKASNYDSGLLLTRWRAENPDQGPFPEAFVSIMEHNGREYYFVVEERDVETNEITSWYWAYDGGLGYVFEDYKHYVLVALTFVFSLFVSLVNYNSTLDKGKKTETFQKTLGYYQNKKEKVSGYTQLLPVFCSDKTREAHEQEKRTLVESANINWDEYVNDTLDYSELEHWQIKRLDRIKKIKVIRLRASDLLYETEYDSSIVRLLPQSQEEHRKQFMIKGAITKFFTSFASGLVAGFGVILGNWVLGLVFGFAIILSAVWAVVAAADFVTNTLKSRFIGKADLLKEFDNVKEQYWTEHEKKQEEKRVEQEKREELHKKLQEKPIQEEKDCPEQEKRSLTLENAV